MMSINEFKYPTKITMENLIKLGEKMLSGSCTLGVNC